MSDSRSESSESDRDESVATAEAVETGAEGESHGSADKDVATEQQLALKVIKEEARKTKKLVVLLSNLLMLFGVTLIVGLIVVFSTSWDLRAESCVTFFLLGMFCVAAGIGMKHVYIGRKKLGNLKINVVTGSGGQRAKFTFRRKTEAEMRRAIPRGFLIGVCASLLLCSVTIILGESLNMGLYHDGYMGSDFDWVSSGISAVSALAASSGLVLALFTSRKSAVAAFLLGFCSFVGQTFLILFARITADDANYLYQDYHGTTDGLLWHYFGSSNQTVLHYPFMPTFLFMNMQCVPPMFAAGLSLFLSLTAIASMFYVNLGSDGEDDSDNDLLEAQGDDAKGKSIVMSLSGSALILASFVACVCSFYVVETRLDRYTWRKDQLVVFSWCAAPSTYMLVGLFALITRHHAHRRSFLFILLLPVFVLSAYSLYWTSNAFRSALQEERRYVDKCTNGTDTFCVWKSIAKKPRRCGYYDSDCNDMKDLVLDCIDKEKYCDGVIDLISHDNKATQYYTCEDYDDKPHRGESIRFADESLCTARWAPPFVMVFVGHCLAIITALTIALHTCDELPGSLKALFGAIRSTATYVVLDKDVGGSEENVALT